jgi:hypothetical protein
MKKTILTLGLLLTISATLTASQQTRKTPIQQQNQKKGSVGGFGETIGSKTPQKKATKGKGKQPAKGWSPKFF